MKVKLASYYKLFAVAVCFVIALSFNELFSQTEQESQMPPKDTAKFHARRELFSTLHSQIKDYAKQNIIPDLKVWREQLNKAMSAEDLKKLDELRQQATALHEKAKNDFMEMKKEGKNKGDNMQGPGRGKYREEFMDIASQLKPIMKKYRSEIEKIITQALPKKDAWKNDIKNVVEKWKNDNKEKIEQLKADGAGRQMKDKLQNFKKMFPNFKQKMLFVRFMLWDGKDDSFMFPLPGAEFGPGRFMGGPHGQGLPPGNPPDNNDMNDFRSPNGTQFPDNPFRFRGFPPPPPEDFAFFDEPDEFHEQMKFHGFEDFRLPPDDFNGQEFFDRQEFFDEQDEDIPEPEEFDMQRDFLPPDEPDFD